MLAQATDGRSRILRQRFHEKMNVHVASPFLVLLVIAETVACRVAGFLFGHSGVHRHEARMTPAIPWITIALGSLLPSREHDAQRFGLRRCMTSNCPRSSPCTTSFEPSRFCGDRLQYWPSQPCAMPRESSRKSRHSVGEQFIGNVSSTTIGLPT